MMAKVAARSKSYLARGEAKDGGGALVRCRGHLFGTDLPWPAGKDQAPEPIELLIGEGKTLEIEIPTNSISEAYEVPALSTWSLGETTTNEEGKNIFEVYGKTKSSGSTEQLILVIRKGSDDAEGLDLTAIKNSNEGFNGGKYILMNASRVEIAGTIGTAKFALKPNKYKLISPEPTKIQDDRKYCFAQFFFRKNEDIEPFFSATWRFNEKARSMVFFYHDPKTQQLRVHTIRSYTR
jgi:hypothetical protein